MSGIETSLDRVSDEALARRIAGSAAGAARGEEAELYRRFAPRVRLYGRRHLRSEAAAQDLAQEVLLLAIQKLRSGEVRQPQDIGSFILGTSRMMAMSWQRGARRRESLETEFVHESRTEVQPEIAGLDQPRLEECLWRLADRDRAVLLLTFYADRSASQIAEELGVSAGVVRVIRHRAIARLRACVLRSPA